MATALGRARAMITRWRELTQQADPITGRRVFVAASFTAQPIAPGLGLAVAEASGATPTIEFADYNQIFQVCLQPESFGAATADDVVVLWRIEDVFERDFHSWCNGEISAGDRLFEAATSLGAAVADLAQQHSGAVIVSDAPVPIGFGLDHQDPELLTQLVALQQALNRGFDDGLAGVRVERFRLAALQHAAGTMPSFDRRNWLMYRQPFTESFALQVGASIGDVIAARTRVPPKVLVLDCDDTLWSGVAVDDGIGGLQCSDAFPGFAHRSFQIAVQRLRNQGVLIALASKNDPETVERAFAEVDGMVLTNDDIAARRISWDPKPPAIASIASEINVGIDSVVFVDDSAFEIGAMTVQQPQVRTIQVPEQIEELPDALAESGLFRMMRVTDDDRARTDRIVAESVRSEAGTAMSHDEFLSSLALRVQLFEVGSSELGRVAQLINKTNQFNTTTVRRSESDVSALLDSASARVHAIAVDDRFGDYGIVGVVVSVRTDAGWLLDSVLMSCRVLGRRVETAMLSGVIDSLRDVQHGRIFGRFVDSGRNSPVADLFTRHGFVFQPDTVMFVLEPDASVAVPDHITLTRL